MAKEKYPRFQPMLSGKCPKDLNLNYPIILSEKLDGIRCIIKDGVAYSRTMKPIPNKFIQKCLAGLPSGIDGELICGDLHHPDVRNISQSGVMSEDGEPDFKYYVFDFATWDILDKWYPKTDIQVTVPTKQTFWERYAKLCAYMFEANDFKCVSVVPHYPIKDAIELKKASDYFLNLKAEGVMIRDPNGLYKFGRSTEREGGLLKHKPFQDAEAIIIGFEELMHNENVQEDDVFGRSKRSSHIENQRPGNKLGAFKCKMINKNGQEVYFDLGTGKFTDAQRIEYWHNRKNLLYKVVNFKYQNLTANGIPCVMSFQGFRMD